MDMSVDMYLKTIDVYLKIVDTYLKTVENCGCVVRSLHTAICDS